MAARDAVAVEPHPDEHVAAERLDQPEPFAARARAVDGNPDRAVRQPLQDLLDQREALLDLADADPDAGIDVAGLEHRHFEVEPS